MDICHIPPVSLVGRIPVSHTTHLCIADIVLASKPYREFYLERSLAGDYVILDTAAFEGHSTFNVDLLKALDAVQPSEVVLPDDLSSASRTVALSYDAMHTLRARGYTGQFMVVPHGETLDEYFQCATELMQLISEPKYRLTVGVVEEIEELYAVSRSTIIHWLWTSFGRPLIHLLGVTDNLTEWASHDVRRWVRSCDTSKLIVWGLNGVRVPAGDWELPPYPGRASLGGRLEYFSLDTREHELKYHDIIQNNIADWRRLV